MVMPDALCFAPPSVFVSSTVKEFRDIRSALAYTIKAQGLTVYLSEMADFNVRGDRSAFDECFANIGASDYYILLVGNMRGNLYKEGISITRQEYMIARDQFLSSGRPRLLLYLREATETALKGSQEEQAAAGIDDPDHLTSFIDELRQPQVEGVPNYLTRFRDFEELVHSLTIRLNLGRTLSETLTRHLLVSELLANLALMVRRSGSTAYPRHRYMSDVRQEISITPQQLEQHIVLAENHITSLVFVLVGKTRGEDLRTSVIEECLDRGVFLKFNAVNGTLEESFLHEALRQTVEDIQSLRRAEIPDAKLDWGSNILASIKAKWLGSPHSLSLGGYDLAFAFAHYDRIENIFNGHLALCKVLLGLTEQLPSFERRPASPFGEQENRQLRAERVSAAEIALLIQNNIWPFGTRIPREILGETHEEQVKGIAASLHTTLMNAGIDADSYADVLNKAAENFLNEGTTSPGEGIEDLQSR